MLLSFCCNISEIIKQRNNNNYEGNNKINNTINKPMNINRIWNRMDDQICFFLKRTFKLKQKSKFSL